MITTLQTTLLSWYAANGRHHLPWRDRTIPNRAYAVLVSEIMLQQTQVKVVLERYFFPFLETFPSLEALSLATQDEVLRAWQGLGYYTRARNLHKLACLLQGGLLPSSPKELQKLPGIGAYTAGAIACFGYDRAVSFVDANIKRILTRLFALRNPTQAQLAHQADAILNRKDAFTHNQALLDFGALHCTARTPKCTSCPLQNLCKGREILDHLTPKTPSVSLKKTLHYGIYLKDAQIALTKSTQQLYFGLYNLPQISQQDSIGLPTIGILKHAYTKYQLNVHCHSLDSLNPLHEVIEFFPTSALHSIPLSLLALKILKHLAIL